MDQAPHRWFLSPEERGNPSTGIDYLGQAGCSWIEGNRVTPLIDGSAYFRRLHDELCDLQRGDRVHFTDWRGDADQRLLEDGPTVADLLCDLAHRGVEVRGLVWRSHSDFLTFSADENERLGKQLNEAGAQVLLDQRVRFLGSHHQKLVVIQHRDDSARDVAYVGGIDLCHGRRDDSEHGGDPQQPPMDPRYQGRAPWHDAMLEVRGPAVGDLLRTFIERWDDKTPLDTRTPYRVLIQGLARMPRHTATLPQSFPDPDPQGSHAVQVLRTYGRKRPGFPFAPKGERSIARAYVKAFGLAQSLIYVEDQYLWSEEVATGIAQALVDTPGLRLVAVVPRYPDADGRLSGPPQRLGQTAALQVLREAAPDRVDVFDLENDAGVPIYVHAKVCVVDDTWSTIGSDNFNLRSWTSDSELTCAVLDTTRDDREPRDPGGQGEGARRLARDLRLRLWSEHLQLPPDDQALLDPDIAVDLWRSRAAALDGWYAQGCRGPRPPGRVRRHEPEPVSAAQAVWARPLARLLFDPDGRPAGLRRRGGF